MTILVKGDEQEIIALLEKIDWNEGNNGLNLRSPFFRIYSTLTITGISICVGYFSEK